MARPTIFPSWATDPSALITAPSINKMAIGFEFNEKPAANQWNWLQNMNKNWLDFLDQGQLYLKSGVINGGVVTNTVGTTFAITAFHFINSYGRRIPVSALNKTFTGVIANATQDLRYDMIYFDKSLDIVTASNLIYLSDFISTPPPGNSVVLAVIPVLPSVSYLIEKIITNNANTGASYPSFIGMCLDGIYTIGDPNAAINNINTILTILNSQGGGIVYLYGANFGNKINLSIYVPSNCTLDCSLAGSLFSSTLRQQASLIKMCGRRSTGVISDSNLLTDAASDFRRTGIGSIVIIGATSYRIIGFEAITDGTKVRLGDENMEAIVSPPGACSYQVLVSKAKIIGAHITSDSDGAGRPTAILTDSIDSTETSLHIIKIQDSINCSLENCTLQNDGATGECVKIKGGNANLAIRNVRLIGDKCIHTFPYGSTTPGVGVNINWLVDGLFVTESTSVCAKIYSSISACGFLVGKTNFAYDEYDLPLWPDNSSWGGPAEQLEHSALGEHRCDNVTIEVTNRALNVIPDGLIDTTDLTISGGVIQFAELCSGMMKRITTSQTIPALSILGENLEFNSTDFWRGSTINGFNGYTAFGTTYFVCTATNGMIVHFDINIEFDASNTWILGEYASLGYEINTGSGFGSSVILDTKTAAHLTGERISLSGSFTKLMNSGEQLIFKVYSINSSPQSIAITGNSVSFHQLDRVRA